MLFNKYQYNPKEILKRGYSQNVIAKTENDKSYWVKWILGVEKNNINTKILADKLRIMQKARHKALPELIEYGFDEDQQAFAIVFELLEEVKTLKEKVLKLDIQKILIGLLDLVECLKELHFNYKIYHGDIHPENILIDSKGQFYLIDFGLADITKTLSQAKDLVVFSKEFVAPERTKKIQSAGFPFQSDIYSLGKVIEWTYDELQIVPTSEVDNLLQKLLSESPSERAHWQQVLESLNKIINSFEAKNILVEFQANGNYEYLKDLNSSSPRFILSNTIPKNDNIGYFIDIITEQMFYGKVLWIKSEKKLLFKEIKPLLSLDSQILEKKIKHGKILPFKCFFTDNETLRKENLAPYFKEWVIKINKQNQIHENLKNSKNELAFYQDILEKEKEVIAKNSLRVQYKGFSKKGDEISFNLFASSEKLSSNAFIQMHVEEGNDVNSEGFEYDLSTNSDRKQNKKSTNFSGKPYEFDLDKNILKIKDCDKLKETEIPKSGYLFENISKKEEEKNRQLEAIRKVYNNDVLNPDLIFNLFNPTKLKGHFAEFRQLDKVLQKDNLGAPLSYSYKQQRAIQNAIFKSPLSLIQGPPGTGKTTVITEIVFQILEINPEAKILITSQTNHAVDQVLENLLKNKIPIIRLCGSTSPIINSIKKHTIDKKIEGWKHQVKENSNKNFQILNEKFYEELKNKNWFVSHIFEIILKNKNWEITHEIITNIINKNENLKEIHFLPKDKDLMISKIDKYFGVGIGEYLKIKSLHTNWISILSAIDEKSAINQKLIDSIGVKGATCNHIASKKYSKYNHDFDYVIMDESSKATTAEALVPIIMGKNLILVGDHRQLKPMITNTKEVEKWLREKFKKEAENLESLEDYFNRPSLFEKIFTSIDDDYKTQLTECRRSTKDQVKMTSKYFYENEGDEPIEPVDRPIENEHNLNLAIESSIFFIDIGSGYKNEVSNQSSFNTKSAEIVSNILVNLNQYDKIKEYSFGVITGYSAQYLQLKKQINKKINSNGLHNIRKWNNPSEKFSISVIDRFQGLERDIIILDLVKSGPGLKLGFLEVPNRINVALSRQKKMLFIVGDYYGIINARTTNRLNYEEASLQKYLKALKSEWIVKAEDLNGLFL